jgi:hypothetical protein
MLDKEQLVNQWDKALDRWMREKNPSMTYRDVFKEFLRFLIDQDVISKEIKHG